MVKGQLKSAIEFTVKGRGWGGGRIEEKDIPERETIKIRRKTTLPSLQETK